MLESFFLDNYHKYKLQIKVRFTTKLIEKPESE